MRKWLILLSALSGTAASGAPAWTWVDANGTVHFSDRPVPGARQVELRARRASARRGAARHSRRAATDTPAARRAVPRLDIVSPAEQETLWNIGAHADRAGAIPAAAAVGPSLRLGVRRPAAQLEHEELAVPLPDVFRGKHTLQVVVIDSAGAELMRSREQNLLRAANEHAKSELGDRPAAGRRQLAGLATSAAGRRARRAPGRRPHSARAVDGTRRARRRPARHLSESRCREPVRRQLAAHGGSRARRSRAPGARAARVVSARVRDGAHVQPARVRGAHRRTRDHARLSRGAARPRAVAGARVSRHRTRPPHAARSRSRRAAAAVAAHHSPARARGEKSARRIARRGPASRAAIAGSGAEGVHARDHRGSGPARGARRRHPARGRRAAAGRDQSAPHHRARRAAHRGGEARHHRAHPRLRPEPAVDHRRSESDDSGVLQRRAQCDAGARRARPADLPHARTDEFHGRRRAPPLGRVRRGRGQRSRDSRRA